MAALTARPGSAGSRLVFFLTVFMTVFATLSPARAADPDPWFGRDKALHFGLSATLASGGYGATALFTEDRRVRLAVGGGFAFSLGIAKELWDLSGRGDPSWRDLTWDAVGTVTGLAVAAALDWTVWTLQNLHGSPDARAR